MAYGSNAFDHIFDMGGDGSGSGFKGLGCDPHSDLLTGCFEFFVSSLYNFKICMFKCSTHGFIGLGIGNGNTSGLFRHLN